MDKPNPPAAYLDGQNAEYATPEPWLQRAKPLISLVAGAFVGSWRPEPAKTICRVVAIGLRRR
jgi:hypothetical protein